MHSTEIGPMNLCVELEQWPRATPVRITGYTFHVISALVVTLERDGYVGRGEANSIYSKGETSASMCRQIEALRSTIESGVSRASLQQMLPPGGARNAVDCALWDLEAKLADCAAWQLAGLQKPRPLITTFTCHADEPERMAARALGYLNARAIKLKLTGEELDAQRVLAVRAALPDVWLAVDANQGFGRGFLERLMPVLVEARVALIEQPFAVGEDTLLEGFQSPIPIAADESVQSLADIPALADRYDVVNIKLDKCGGLTEGLAMARALRELGLEAMVGNMSGTSLAMAPAFLVGQLCNVVDLDGPVFLKSDRAITVRYEDGLISCPETLWG